MDLNSGKNPFDKGNVPPKTVAAAPPKPKPPAKAAVTRLQDRVSLGLLSMVIGSVALSLNAIPVLRFLAVLLSLVGLGVAIFELRSPSKEKRNQGRAIAGAIISSFVLVLTAVRPFWSGRIGPIAEVPTTTAPRLAARSTLPTTTAAPSTATSAPKPARPHHRQRPVHLPQRPLRRRV